MESTLLQSQSSLFSSVFDLNELYAQTYSSLNHLKGRYDEENRKLITEKIEEIKQSQTKFNQTKISLVVVGSTCSGKTTLINAFLNAMRNTKDKWIEYLPSNSTENTCTYTFINSVPDSAEFDKTKFYARVNDEPFVKKDSIESLREHLKHFESNNKLFYELKKTQKTMQIALPKIYLNIPDISKTIQIIDTPGISTSSFLQELTKIVQEGVCIFLYVKNLDNVETNNPNVMDFFRITKKFYGQGNYQFWMVFTKEDLFNRKYESDEYDEIEEKNQKKLEKKMNFLKFLENTEDEIKENDIKINKIYVISTLASFKPKHPECLPTQARIKKLIENINEFKEKNGDYFMRFIYVERLRAKLDTLNDQLHKNTQLNVEIIENIKAEAEMIEDSFSNQVRKLLDSDSFQKINTLKQNYKDKYITCEHVIEKAKKKIKKETFLLKEKYERRILELVSQEIHNLLLRDELKNIFFQCYLIFESYLLKLIDKTLLDYLLGLDTEVLNQQESSLTSIIKENIYNPMVDLTLDIKDLNIFDLTNNLFNPGYREVFFAYLTVKLLNIDSYVEFFPHTVSKESIMEFILKNIKENSERIIETSRTQFELFINQCIIRKLEKAKEMNQEINDIIKKINKIRSGEIRSLSNSLVVYVNSIYEKIEKTTDFKNEELSLYFVDYMKGFRIRKSSK